MSEIRKLGKITSEIPVIGTILLMSLAGLAGWLGYASLSYPFCGLGVNELVIRIFLAMHGIVCLFGTIFFVSWSIETIYQAVENRRTRS